MQSRTTRPHYAEPAKHSNYFRLRPATTSRQHISEQKRSLDPSPKRKEHSEIDFRRDRLLFQSKHNIFESKYSQVQLEKREETVYRSRNETLQPPMDNLQASLARYLELTDSTNDFMRNIVREEILSELSLNDPIFHRLDRHLLESLLLIGKIKRYQDDESLGKLEDGLIGFVLAGRLKIFNQDYKGQAERGDTVGQHVIFGYGISLKARSLEESYVFWLPHKYYSIMREQSIKNGLKGEFGQLEAALRLAFIRKRHRHLLTRL